jgi:histidyl-tRNA synthetase
VLNLDNQLMPSYLNLAQQLRQAGIATINNFETSKMGDQLKKAEKLGIEIAVIQGSIEQAENRCQIKVLATRQQQDVLVTELAATVQGLLGKVN